MEMEGRVSGQNPETRRLRPARRPKRRSCAVGVKGGRRAFARFAGRVPVSNGTHCQAVRRGASPPRKRPEKKFGKGLDICRAGCYNMDTCLLWGQVFPALHTFKPLCDMRTEPTSSRQNMTDRQAWFHFWILSFPAGVHTKDWLNPSRYYTDARRKTRRVIHLIILIMICIIISTLLSMAFHPNTANAQSRTCTPQGICYGSAVPGGSSYNPGYPVGTTYGPTNYDGGAYGYDPNNVGHMGSHAPDPCVQRHLGQLSSGYNSPIVIQNAYNAMAMCMLGRSISESGYLPNTACEYSSITAMAAGIMGMIAGAGSSVVTYGASSSYSALATWSGALAFSSGYFAYLGCDR